MSEVEKITEKKWSKGETMTLQPERADSRRDGENYLGSRFERERGDGDNER